MKRVLILEDNFDLGVSWQTALENAGIVAVLTTRLSDAIERLSGDRFDLIICDVFILGPEGTPSSEGGLSLLAHIDLHLDYRPPVLAVTGSSVKVDVLRTTKMLGAAHGMRKPFSPGELVTTCHNLLANADK